MATRFTTRPFNRYSGRLESVLGPIIRHRCEMRMKSSWKIQKHASLGQVYPAAHRGRFVRSRQTEGRSNTGEGSQYGNHGPNSGEEPRGTQRTPRESLPGPRPGNPFDDSADGSGLGRLGVSLAVHSRLLRRSDVPRYFCCRENSKTIKLWTLSRRKKVAPEGLAAS